MLLEAGESTIGYDSYGNGDDVLVMLHAFPLSRGQWDALGRQAASDRHLRVIAPDLRGFGESSIQVGPTTMDEMAADVHGLIDELHLGRIILGGISMGGYVALAFMRAWPERVRGLILADTRATADSRQQRSGRERTARLATERGPLAVLERDLPKLLGPHTLREQPEVIARVRALTRVNSDIGVSAASLGMALRPDNLDEVGAVQCPTLVLVGEDDHLTPLSDARALYERMPHAHLALIPDAGHLSNLEQPEAFNSHVLGFVESTLRAPHPAGAR